MKFRTFLLLLLSVGLSLRASLAQSQMSDVTTSFRCPVAVPNGSEPPPGEPPTNKAFGWMAERNREGDTLLLATTLHDLPQSRHGNGKLWTILPDRPHWVGERQMYMEWWKSVAGRLTITGRRLDGPAGPLHAEENRRALTVQDGIAQDGISRVMLGVIFLSEGCWEVTGKIDDIGDSALTFVVEIRFPE
jgi:hypothetical protein